MHGLLLFFVIEMMYTCTVLPALRVISSLILSSNYSLHRWRSMKVAARIFCTHTHPCNIDMNIK